jgi:AcrR family transcriptional regulator
VAKSGQRAGTTTGTDARSNATRQALVDAAIESLRFDGFSGASARTIATRAQSTQGLVFYHFGSVTDLLLAALDEVSNRRMERYSAAVGAADSPAQLATVAAQIFREDLDEGYVTVLVEMMAGATASPALGEEVAKRLVPWLSFTRQVIDQALTGTPFATVVPTDEAAYAVVALYLGLELLSHLDGDRSRALALFERASSFAALFDTGATSPLEAG